MSFVAGNVWNLDWMQFNWCTCSSVVKLILTLCAAPSAGSYSENQLKVGFLFVFHYLVVISYD